MTESATIVQRLWNYCSVLRDDGFSYGDYVEQLTYLLFLKMDNEQVVNWGRSSQIDPEHNWAGPPLGPDPDRGRCHHRSPTHHPHKNHGPLVTP